MFVALFFVVCFLAYSNGANDNFKGVATLLGSRTSSYRTALWWACGTTLAGAVFSIFFSRLLVLRFSGQELVPAAVAQSPAFVLAVALAAALTVITATTFGLPISTTHGLVGALLGAGLVAARSEVQFSALTNLIVMPLLLSPILAIVLCYGLYRFIERTASRFGRADAICVCAEASLPLAVYAADSADISDGPSIMQPLVGTRIECENWRAWPLVNLRSTAILDCAHYFSAGIVSFARGLNDTPKIAALLSLTSVPLAYGFIGVAVAMMLGGLLNARKVAATMSDGITPLTHPQGFAANVVTGALVLFASRTGIPVSTTHVSVGSLFGVGIANGSVNKRKLNQIVLAWVFTLPAATVSAALLYLLLG